MGKDSTSRLIAVPVRIKPLANSSSDGHPAMISIETRFHRLTVATTYLTDTDPIGALAAGARKEIAYLTQYGRSLLPFNPVRREIYGYKELSPTEHLTSLEQ